MATKHTTQYALHMYNMTETDGEQETHTEDRDQFYLSFSNREQFLETVAKRISGWWFSSLRDQRDNLEQLPVCTMPK